MATSCPGHWRRSRSATAGAFFLFALAAHPLLGSAQESVTDDNVTERIATAKTAADHAALASYFRARAEDSAARAKKHEAMLASYKKLDGRPYEIWKTHCESLIASFRASQKDYEKLAAEHQKLAGELGAP